MFLPRLLTTIVLGTCLVACDPPAAAPSSPPSPSQAPKPQAAPLAPAAPASPADDGGVITRFKANGNSPAWSAEIDGETVAFEVPETVVVKRTAKVERLAYAKGVDYSGKDDAVEFTLSIDGKECVKTGAKREFTATFRYGKSTYHGCADAVK